MLVVIKFTVKLLVYTMWLGLTPTQGQYAKTNIVENKTRMKKIIRLTESDLHQIIENSVRRILKEDFNQYSDGDFASTGDPYEMGDDDIDPTSDVSHLKPEDLTKVYVWDTGDSYYDFMMMYLSEAVLTETLILKMLLLDIVDMDTR